MSTETARPITGDTAKRRTQAVAGAVAGVAVIAVLVTVFVTVRGGSDEPAAQPAAAPASAEAAPEAVPTEAAPTEPAPGAPAPVSTPPELSKEPVVKPGTGKLTELKVTPLVAGRGPAVKAGQTVTANYVLISYTKGEVIDSSWKRGEPFSTPIGTGRVIQGWDKGIPGQKVGSRIQIDVPAAMAYGDEQGDLRFVVDILAAQ
ncbi:FKBP-type peptidyl-prolyl cis-trans isomerase [Paractinoplanes lichenicola]|uniref:Peptidyl-prolyl cis-trans isomerase n=1 Tax=Paractinoplanes lichenicola TaxID=2802976 RepID=A0ABS1W4X3_9ACTN|nr:FKBP-type peptidyl-prolyl cis-trans isomerase [Actinoplanes lichenicola]MBL7261774.1 FKBP-type peptidyl-prolyl cis-trans isomerase [Actinoplanes lichenicola]